MDEITRFQHLRQAQKLSGELKAMIGLALFPAEKTSDLVTMLKNAGCDKAQVASVLASYRDSKKGKVLISELEQVNAFILAFYRWLDYKAKPIKVGDFEEFVASITVPEDFDLVAEWVVIGDSLIVAFINSELGASHCIDFQMLVRVCHIIRRCVKIDDGKATSTATYHLLNELINLAILLPGEVGHGRYCESCADKQKIEVPTGPAFKAEKTHVKVELARKKGHEENAPCECHCDDGCQEASTHCVRVRTYIADLFIVKEELTRYESGDIADIENILAGEKKVRRHRNLLRTEDSLEQESETITSDERDHQVSEKFSLQSEVKSTVDSKVNLDAGVTATLKYGPAVTITPHANVTANFAKSQSENIARSYAKDLVDQSVTKIQEKVRRLQISKVVSELEERNKHSIDNSDAAAEHRAGIYYWVNKITRAQVFNYGKHMMFDVIVPEPAAIFKKLFKMKIQKANDENAPVKPTVTPTSITRATYGALLAQYSIATTEECQAPDDTTAVQFAFSQNVSETDADKTMGFSSHEFKSPEIPKGYKATTMKYEINCATGNPANTVPYDEVAVNVHLGNICIFSESMNEKSAGMLPNENWASGQKTQAMNGEEGILTLAVSGFTTLGLCVSGTVSVTCTLTDEAFQKWQAKIYNLVMADYARKLTAYESGSNKNDQLIQIKGRNPFLNREIERNEFKRNIIAVLMCNYFNGMGSMMEKVAPCGYPEINFEQLEKNAPIIQFFEQVFDWSYITYLFYHSMWARKCKWPELIDEDSGDALFDKFLMSGAARVQVPVRLGMEEVFSWFLKTGQIWGASGVPPIASDDTYISMIQELKESKECDYTDRPGLVVATQGSDQLVLTGSTYYWDAINNKVNTLNVDNDVDREILINYETYRIVSVAQVNAVDPTAWNIKIDRPYPEVDNQNLTHAVGALYVGTPWEIVIPTKLVYLRNSNDTLPVYPLN